MRLQNVHRSPTKICFLAFKLILPYVYVGLCTRIIIYNVYDVFRQLSRTIGIKLSQLHFISAVVCTNHTKVLQDKDYNMVIGMCKVCICIEYYNISEYALHIHWYNIFIIINFLRFREIVQVRQCSTNYKLINYEQVHIVILALANN